MVMGKLKLMCVVIWFMLLLLSDLVVEASFAASERVRDLYEFVVRCVCD